MPPNTINIPDEGLKLVCVAGTIDGKTIWKQVGILKRNKRNNITIYLDKTFNPAGAVSLNPTDPTVAVQAMAFSVAELQAKQQFNSPRQKTPEFKQENYRRDDEFDDDIPF